MKVTFGKLSGTAGAPTVKQAGQKFPEHMPPPPPPGIGLEDGWTDGVWTRPGESLSRHSVMKIGVVPAGVDSGNGIAVPSLTFLPKFRSFHVMPLTRLKPVAISRSGGWLPSKITSLNCAVRASAPATDIRSGDPDTPLPSNRTRRVVTRTPRYRPDRSRE